MLRKFFSRGNDAMRKHVGIYWPDKLLGWLALAVALGWLIWFFATLFTLRPSAELGVGSGCAGLGSRRLLAAFTARLGGQFAAVGCPFVTAIRAFHCP